MCVFDCGYNNNKYWYDIELARTFFVTRLKSNAKYRVIQKKKVSGKNGILSDRIIKIIGTKDDEYKNNFAL
jgi:hypothetical protein